MSRYLPRYQHFSGMLQVQKDNNNKKLLPYRHKYKAKFHLLFIWAVASTASWGKEDAYQDGWKGEWWRSWTMTSSFVCSKWPNALALFTWICLTFAVNVVPLILLYGKMKINKKTFTEMTIEHGCTNHRADQGAFWGMMEWSRSSLMSELERVLSLPFMGKKKAIIVIILSHSVLHFNH